MPEQIVYQTGITMSDTRIGRVGSVHQNCAGLKSGEEKGAAQKQGHGRKPELSSTTVEIHGVLLTGAVEMCAEILVFVKFGKCGLHRGRLC